jgi:hypothetical protein
LNGRDLREKRDDNDELEEMKRRKMINTRHYLHL